MDKFVRKSDISKFGLASIEFENKTNNYKNFNTELTLFKKKLILKLNRFDPTKISDNKTDELIKLLWLSHVFNNITNEKRNEIYLQCGIQQ